MGWSAPPGLPGLDDGAYRRRGAAADVQRREAPGAGNLVARGLPCHLQVAVQQHPHPCRPDRVADTDETTTRVDRQGAVASGDTAVYRVPAATGFGQTEVVDRHVLRDGEAVVGLDAVQLRQVPDAGPGECIQDGVAHMRED